MKTPPLHPLHIQLKAKFTEFAGYQMPLQYSSIVEEVMAVRSSAGLFDISQMERLWIRGKDAKQKLDFLTTNSLEELKWGLTVEDWTFQSVQIALQGKSAEKKLRKYFGVSGLKRYNFLTVGNVIISRTGYTREDGFEIYTPIKEGIEIFEAPSKEVQTCGLGARDVLRIEAGMPLYGRELSEDISPLMASLDRFVSREKDFLGKDEMYLKEPQRKLFGLELREKGVPREGYRIEMNRKAIGVVSSGTFSPTLKKGIALCFVDKEYLQEGTEVELVIREKPVRAVLRRYPFIK